MIMDFRDLVCFGCGGEALELGVDFSSESASFFPADFGFSGIVRYDRGFPTLVCFGVKPKPSYEE